MKTKQQLARNAKVSSQQVAIFCVRCDDCRAGQRKWRPFEWSPICRPNSIWGRALAKLGHDSFETFWDNGFSDKGFFYNFLTDVGYGLQTWPVDIPRIPRCWRWLHIGMMAPQTYIGHHRWWSGFPVLPGQFLGGLRLKVLGNLRTSRRSLRSNLHSFRYCSAISLSRTVGQRCKACHLHVISMSSPFCRFFVCFSVLSLCQLDLVDAPVEG
jgi:hypothetical protein